MMQLVQQTARWRESPSPVFVHARFAANAVGWTCRRIWRRTWFYPHAMMQSARPFTRPLARRSALRFALPGICAAACLTTACAPLPDAVPALDAASTQHLIAEETFVREHGAAPATNSASASACCEDAAARVTILPASPISASSSTPLLLRLERVPLPVFARMLSQATNYNIVADAGIKAPLSLRLDAVGWRDALALAAGQHGLALSEQPHGRLIRVHRRGAAPGDNNAHGARKQVELFRLNFSSPGEVKPLLDALLHQDGADKRQARAVVVADERSHSLVVKGAQRDIALAASLIREVDTRHRQVLIEAFIVEAGEDFERSLGVRLGREQGIIFRGSGGGGTDGGGPFVNLPVAGAAAGLGLRFGKPRIRLELTALENEGKSRIISNPRVFTLDKQPAVIFQGDEVPYQTVSQDGTRTEFKQAGLRLAVTPTVIGDEHLMLDVKINKDTVDTRLQNPPITRREIASRLLVADGDMVVIGGIRLDTRVDSVNRVPLAGSLPLLGGLFRRNAAERDVRELLVFILPEIVQ